jgi:hypothetical protein
MGHLFDKDMLTVWPASVPTPFSSENHLPSVSIIVYFGLLFVILGSLSKG